MQLTSQVIPISPLGVTPWDFLLLISICIGPAHPKISLLIVIASSLAIAMLTLKDRSFKPTPQAWLVAALFLVYFGYFYLQGAWVGGDIKAPFDSMKGNIPLLLIAVWCLGMNGQRSNITPNRIGHWAAIAMNLIVVTAIAAYLSQVHVPSLRSELIGDMWHGGTGGRLKFYARNALMFGSMCTALAFMALIGSRNKTAPEKALAITALISGLLMVSFWVESRGAMLASLPLIALSIWYLRPKLVHSALLIALLTGAGIGLYNGNEQVQVKTHLVLNRIANGVDTATNSIINKDDSVTQRLTMYRLGIEAIKDSPLKGYGYQNRFDAILPYLAPEQTFRHGHLHNAFIDHWVAGGALGFLVFLAFVLSPIALVSLFGPSSRDSKFFAGIITLTLTGIGMTTEVLGHYVHANFYGLLICALAVVAAGERRQAKLG